MDLMTALAAIPAAGPLLPYIAAAITICAGVAIALPHPAAGATGIYPTIYAVVNFIALNFGHARNAEAPAAPRTPPAA
ncbi:hypothetical protein [Rhodopila sp.]|uniref:hypothetical protein n=1 Tax=Rhodopila sp. TaxID=2480087 RepID=UPI003D0F51D9